MCIIAWPPLASAVSPPAHMHDNQRWPCRSWPMREPERRLLLSESAHRREPPRPRVPVALWRCRPLLRCGSAYFDLGTHPRSCKPHVSTRTGACAEQLKAILPLHGLLLDGFAHASHSRFSTMVRATPHQLQLHAISSGDSACTCAHACVPMLCSTLQQRGPGAAQADS